MTDRVKIEAAVKLLIEGIGDDVSREGLRETPERIARMYAEIFGGMNEDAGVHLSKTFSIMSNDIIIEKDIVFYSMCEHHLMPFFGKAHIAYIPRERAVGLSKLARTVETFAKRPQIQENMTAQIADAIMEHLNPVGAAVVLSAQHLCMTMRGVKKPGSMTVTSAARGEIDKDIVRILMG